MNRPAKLPRANKTVQKAASKKSIGKCQGRLKVGVTLYLREGTQSLWENGIFQNCGFLLMLLAKSPHIERCFVVNGGPGNPTNAKDFLSNAPAPVITMDEAMEQLDVIVELSAQLNPEWGKQFKQRGGKIVGMRVASDFVIDAERMAYNLEPGMLMSHVPYDEIWTLPAFAKTCASYYEYGFQAPVRVMQHLWSPILVDKSAKDHGRPFAYQPGRQRWRLAVMEPNICSVKTCHLPMILCDVAHRHDPTRIEDMKVFNALALKEHASFVSFARSLELVKQGIGTFEGRFPIFQIMTEMSDAIISHHWQNGQNYLYYEALHGGFPLIHNSTFLGGCGYAYRDFNPEDGALALLRAMAEHDLNLGSYKAEAKTFLATLDPCNPANIRSYGEALLALARPQAT